MARRKTTGHRDSSGTAGGTDIEPLRGGMREIERGEMGLEHAGERRADVERETSAKKSPPAPYHAISVPEEGLSPHAMPGEGPTPGPSRGELEATTGKKIAQERLEVENEAANAPRTAPGSRGKDE